MNLTLYWIRAGRTESLYTALWFFVGEQAAVIRSTSVPAIVDAIQREYGLTLTESQVRHKLDELAKQRLVELVRLSERGTFDLYVYQPAPDKANEQSTNSADYAQKYPLFAALDSTTDFATKSVTESETSVSAESSQLTKEYKINNKIKPQSSLNSEEPVGNPDTLEEPESRPLVDAVVEAFPRDCEWYEKNRRLLARELYEPGLHADLLDRAVVAVGMKYASVGELKAAIRAAKEEQLLRTQTNGFKGRRTLWETFAPLVKSWYDGAGVVWTPTSFRREPAPPPTHALVEV